MIRIESLLLHGWRAVACVGYHTRLTSLYTDDTNSVLRYHSVGGGFYDNISPDRLRQDIAYLDSEYEIVDLPEVRNTEGTNKVALTFDDGYRDFYRNVVPILEEFDVPATVFVITDAVDDPSFTHNDHHEYEYMNWDELETLVENPHITVGNHTRSHPDLTECSATEIEQEILGAKDRLEEMLETDIERFCFPFCQYDSRAAEYVRASHEIGVAGRGRREVVSADTDPAAVPRINGANPPWEVRWDLSGVATLVGSACEWALGPEPPAESDLQLDHDAVGERLVDSSETPQGD